MSVVKLLWKRLAETILLLLQCGFRSGGGGRGGGGYARRLHIRLDLTAGHFPKQCQRLKGLINAYFRRLLVFVHFHTI